MAVILFLSSLSLSIDNHDIAPTALYDRPMLAEAVRSKTTSSSGPGVKLDSDDEVVEIFPKAVAPSKQTMQPRVLVPLVQPNLSQAEDGEQDRCGITTMVRSRLFGALRW